jgi:non-ribosomal peptide synthetase component F
MLLDLNVCPLLSPPIETWNDTKKDVSGRTKDPLHVVFEGHAQNNPSSLALTDGGKVLSYRQLNVRANQIAHYLRSKGVGPNVNVAVCVRRSIDMIASFLAVIKAGGSYVACDPAYPSARLQYMFTDAKVCFHFTSYAHEITVVDSNLC